MIATGTHPTELGDLQRGDQGTQGDYGARHGLGTCHPSRDCGTEPKVRGGLLRIPIPAGPASRIVAHAPRPRARYEVVTGNMSCSFCGYPLMSRSFYVFPCSHAFHKDCLIREVRCCVSCRVLLSLSPPSLGAQVRQAVGAAYCAAQPSAAGRGPHQSQPSRGRG